MRIFLTDISAVDEKTLANYQNLLTFFEKNRFDKTSSLKAKKSFLIGRVLIKSSLSKILNCDIAEIKLKVLASGQVVLQAPQSNLKFNLSHSENLAVLAVSENEIGIDIEFCKKRNFEEIAEEFFTKEEVLELKSSTEKQKLFYKFWTKKEAFIKCNGEQIFNNSKKMDENYRFTTLEPEENYVMSVVVKSKTILEIPEIERVKF